MKVKSLELYSFQLELHQPLTIKGHKNLSRQGLILVLKNSDGVIGLGEASPLLGLSSESLLETTDQLKNLKNPFIQIELTEELTRIDGQMTSLLSRFGLSPSAQYAVEMAILNLFANAKGIRLSELLSRKPLGALKMTGLLNGPKFHIVRLCNHMMNHKFQTVKLKVGANLDEDIENVRSVRKIIHDKATLILDGNQQFELAQAIKFGKTIGKQMIDYIEEPVKNPLQMQEFFEATGIETAADESLKTLDWNQLKAISACKTLIVKPTIVGGIEKTWDFVRKAEESGHKIVISSAYESSIGLSTLLECAAANPFATSAGLDTLKTFRTDLLKTRIFINQGQIPVPQILNSFDLLNTRFLSRAA